MNKIKIQSVTFSWERAFGLTNLKQKNSRQTEAPMSKSGIERKIGRTLLNSLYKK